MKHSPTSMKTWQNCPRLYKAKYIDRVLPYVQSPAAQRGSEIHDKLERAVNTGAPPEDVWTPTGLVQALHKAGAVTEISLAITKEFQCTGYKSAGAWVRGKLDVLVPPRGGKAIVADWKTGKVRPDKIQADVYTALVQAWAGDLHMPVEFRFVYVDQKEVVPLNRDPDTAGARVRLLAEQIEADGDYLPQPGWLCRYCDYHACQFNVAKRV